MMGDQIEEKLKRVQFLRAEGKALPSDLLPTDADMMAVLTGSSASVAYLIAFFHALHEEQQRLATRIQHDADTGDKDEPHEQEG